VGVAVFAIGPEGGGAEEGGFEKAKGISQPGEGWQWQSRRAAGMDPGCGSDGWASRDGRG